MKTLQKKNYSGGNTKMKKLRKRSFLCLIAVIAIISQAVFCIPGFAFEKRIYSNKYLNSSHFIDDSTYYNIDKEKITLTKAHSSDWFNSLFEPTFNIKWILNPNEPITLVNFLRLIHDMQIYEEPNKNYPRNYEKFLDKDDYRLLFDMIEILSATGTWNNPSILNGTPVNNGIELRLNEYMTRQQGAKIIDTACTDWYKLKKTRESIDFSDVLDDSWAKDYVKNAYSYGFINGVGENNFAPTAYLSNQEAFSMIYNISIANPKYDINTFVAAINYSDFVKITNVNSPEFTDTVGAKLIEIDYYFAHPPQEISDVIFPDDAYAPENAVHYSNGTAYSIYDYSYGYAYKVNPYIFLTGRTGPIEIIYAGNSEIVKIESDGYLSIHTPGTYTFKITNECGATENIDMVIYAKSLDFVHMREFQKNSLSTKTENPAVRVNQTVDLYDYLENVTGDIIVRTISVDDTIIFDGISKFTFTSFEKPVQSIIVYDDISSVEIFFNVDK